MTAIYLNVEQQNVINAMKELLAKEISDKRDCTILPKVIPVTLVTDDIHVKYVNGLLTTVSYNKIDLGRCRVHRLKASDIEYPIEKINEFNYYKQKNKDFILVIGYRSLSDNGCGPSGYYARPYTENYTFFTYPNK
jgi:hypothetical protein